MRRIKAGYDGLILSPSIPHFTTSTQEEFWKWIPWDRVVDQNKTKGWIQFEAPPNRRRGARVFYGGIEDEDRWRGPNVNWLWFDESARKKTDLAWLITIACVRIPPNPCAWTTTTPRGRRHWLHRFFEETMFPPEVIKALAEEGYTRELASSHRISIQDNLRNLDPGFYANMMAAYAKRPRLAKQEIDGEYIEEYEAVVSSEWIQVISAYDLGGELKRLARGWDFAATTKSYSDYTAGAKCGWLDGMFVIEHICHGQWTPGVAEQQVIKMAALDGKKCKILLSEERGESGKRANASLARRLHGYTVKSIRETGDKLTRASGWFAQAEMNNVLMVDGPWRDPFFDELDNFLHGYDDIIDGISLVYGRGLTGGVWSTVFRPGEGL